MFKALTDDFLMYLYHTFIRPRQLRVLMLWAAENSEVRVTLKTREVSRSGEVISRFMGGKLIHQGGLTEWEIHGRFLVPGGWDTIFPFHAHEVGEICFFVPEEIRTSIPADAGQFIVQVCGIEAFDDRGSAKQLAAPALPAPGLPESEDAYDAQEDHEDAERNGDYKWR